MRSRIAENNTVGHRDIDAVKDTDRRVSAIRACRSGRELYGEIARMRCFTIRSTLDYDVRSAREDKTTSICGVVNQSDDAIRVSRRRLERHRIRASGTIGEWSERDTRLVVGSIGQQETGVAIDRYAEIQYHHGLSDRCEGAARSDRDISRQSRNLDRCSRNGKLDGFHSSFFQGSR